MAFVRFVPIWSGGRDRPTFYKLAARGMGFLPKLRDASVLSSDRRFDDPRSVRPEKRFPRIGERCLGRSGEGLADHAGTQPWSRGSPPAPPARETDITAGFLKRQHQLIEFRDQSRKPFVSARRPRSHCKDRRCKLPLHDGVADHNQTGTGPRESGCAGMLSTASSFVGGSQRSRTLTGPAAGRAWD
jgi:hypothetical protein